MKQRIFTFSVLLCAALFSTQAFARRVYVKLHADATAWTDVAANDDNVVITLPENSTDFVGNVLSQLQEGDEVWVAKGVYENTATLVLDLNVTLYGGFAGTETAIADRAIADRDKNGLIEPWEFVNETNFKGKGNNPDTPSDFQLIQLIQETTLDGVTISDNSHATSAAGGEVKDHALIRNCIIKDMTVKNSGSATIKGAGLYVTGGGVESCLFESCVALTKTQGGALHIYGINDNTAGEPTGYIKNSVVRNCSTIDQGGAVFGKGGVIIENCVFYNNFAGANGGVVFFHNNGDGNKHVNRIIGCTFVNNSSNQAVRLNGYYADFYNTVTWGNETKNNNYSNNLYFNNGKADIAYPFADGIAWHGTIENKITSLEEAQKNKDVTSILLTGAIRDDAEDTNNPLFTRATTFAGVATTDEQLEEIRKANWTLQEGSPLIDAGVDAPTNQLEGHDQVSLVLDAFSATDLMGNARVSKYDIGAYEYLNEGPGTGVDMIAAQPFDVYVANGCITVDKLNGNAEISVYGLNGVRLFSQKTDAPRVSLPFAEQGFYIISIQMNGKTYSEKVVL